MALGRCTTRREVENGATAVGNGYRYPGDIGSGMRLWVSESSDSKPSMKNVFRQNPSKGVVTGTVENVIFKTSDSDPTETCVVAKSANGGGLK